MDRLLCGDVGFGKTEVAFQAAFKAINVRDLSEAEIGIVYMYSLFLHGKGLLFIRADKPEEAREVIRQTGLRCVPEKELPEWGS